MVGIVYLRTDLCIPRTTAPKLHTATCQLIDNLGIQRRPTNRGCRAGWLLRQRRCRPVDNILTEIETETDPSFTTTPIPVIPLSKRRTSRSTIRRCPLSSSVNISPVSRSSTTQRFNGSESDSDSEPLSSSATILHETTASSWCPSSLSPDEQSTV